MSEKLEKLIEKFVEVGQPDIKRRILKLILASSFLTFLAIFIISMLGMIGIWQIFNVKSEKLSESTANYTEKFIEEQATTHLKNVTKSKSQQINEDMASLHDDLIFVVSKMNLIMNNPQNYLPKRISNSREKIIYSNEPYVHYGASIVKNGEIEKIAEEVALESNIAETLVEVSNYYDGMEMSICVGSKENFMICIDTVTTENKIIEMTEFFMNEYEITKRNWYELAESERKFVFTNIYTSAEGNYRITGAMPYNKNGEFAGVVGIDSNLENIYEIIFSDRQDDKSINICVDDDGKILISSENEGKFSVGNEFIEYKTVESIKSDEVGMETVNIDGKEYYMAFTKIEMSGWYFVTLLEKSHIIEPAKTAKFEISEKMDGFQGNLIGFFRQLLMISIISTIILIILLYIFGKRESKKFVEPILELSDGVREIVSGNFEKKLEIHTNDEIEHLAICFNAMTEEIKNYTANLQRETAEKNRIATQLEVATNIQVSMLPRDFDFGRNDFEIFASMEPAKEVGGDFYDFYLLDEDHLIFTMADVSGKGIPAALFMVVSKTILKNFALTMKSPEDLAAAVTCTNNQLCQNNEEMLFVTVFIGVLELKTGKLTYVNAAHESLLYYSAKKDKFEYIRSEKRNYSLGLIEEMDYEAEELQLEPGDVILQYTDGVTEAKSLDGKFFGEERLLESLNSQKTSEMSVNEILSQLRKSINEFVTTAPQSDDITMIGIRANLQRNGD